MVHSQLMTSRADIAVNFSLLSTLCAPVLVYVGSRLAARGDFERHRRHQLWTLVLCWIAVLVLEGRIRLEGGSGSFVASAAAVWRPLARATLLVHISGAVATYLLWTWLVTTSWMRYGATLPGPFGPRHRRLAWVVFAGLVFTAVSAVTMYSLVFVL